MLMPSRFIPIAEATGTIVRLGAWVLERAVADLSASRHTRTVGINVSAVQMLQSDLPAEVARVLERHRVEPARLVIEITESAILPDSVRLRDQLAELRQMGVLVAIDDFGSGYSSIGYLDWIPVDIVKLDRAFLLGDLDRRRRNLVAAAAQLVRSIGARSLAEGIETDEQWDVAREAGVDYGQGYMFGRATLPIRVVADEAGRSA
jgi:EAL domain-containing protein (putative c-di-GMP-specific phosphodiesterase class I)